MTAIRGRVAALVLLLAGCAAPRSEVPADLRGVWTTEDARFEGRSLELRATSLTLVTGLEPATTHDVVGVAARAADDDEYEIHYLVGGRSEMTLAVRLDPAGGALYLTNRPTVRWTRTSE